MLCCSIGLTLILDQHQLPAATCLPRSREYHRRLTHASNSASRTVVCCVQCAVRLSVLQMTTLLSDTLPTDTSCKPSFRRAMASLLKPLHTNHIKHQTVHCIAPSGHVCVQPACRTVCVHAMQVTPHVFTHTNRQSGAGVTLPLLNGDASAHHQSAFPKHRHLQHTGIHAMP